MGNQSNVPVEVWVLRETDAAWLVDCGGENVWVPANQVDYDESDLVVGHAGVMVLPEWLAIDKGMI